MQHWLAVFVSLPDIAIAACLFQQPRLFFSNQRSKRQAWGGKDIDFVQDTNEFAVGVIVYIERAPRRLVSSVAARAAMPATLSKEQGNVPTCKCQASLGNPQR